MEQAEQAEAKDPLFTLRHANLAWEVFSLSQHSFTTPTPVKTLHIHRLRVMSDIPEGWSQKESKSHPGKLYYINNVSGETVWKKPTAPATAAGQVDQVQVLHILRKHAGSRRPASWRCDNINQSKQDSIQQCTDIKASLEQTLKSQGYNAMLKMFKDVAYEQSDCGSHEKGGDLGMFGRGKLPMFIYTLAYLFHRSQHYTSFIDHILSYIHLCRRYAEVFRAGIFWLANRATKWYSGQ